MPIFSKFAGSRLSMDIKLSSEHQLSVQKLMKQPSPTFQRIPRFINDLNRSRHFHTQESAGLALDSKTCSGAPYFALICWTQKFSGWVRNFYTNFAKKAVFTAADFRSPSPANCLGRQILSHAINGNPMWEVEFFQKKSRFMRSIWSVILLGNLWHCLVGVGKVSRLDWIRTTRPALEKHFAFQLSSLELALVVRVWKSSASGRPWKREHPKYFPNDELCGMLKIPPTTCLSRGRVFLENMMVDLWKLTNCPDCAQNISSTLFSFWQAWDCLLYTSDAADE